VSRRHGGRDPAGVAYWLAVLLLIGFGFLAILSIGWPFLLLGAGLGVLGPLRSKPQVFRTAVVLMLGTWVGFLAGYLAVGPLTCSATASETTRTVIETCRSVTGIEYDGPRFAPGLIAGGVGAVAGMGASWLIARRLNRRFGLRRTHQVPHRGG